MGNSRVQGKEDEELYCGWFFRECEDIELRHRYPVCVDAGGNEACSECPWSELLEDA